MVSLIRKREEHVISFGRIFLSAASVMLMNMTEKKLNFETSPVTSFFSKNEEMYSSLLTTLSTPSSLDSSMLIRPTSHRIKFPVTLQVSVSSSFLQP